MTDETLPPPFDIDFAGPFTIDEVIEIEELAGKPITDLLVGERGRSLRAVAYVVGRRSNPNLTLADAGEMWVRVDG